MANTIELSVKASPRLKEAASAAPRFFRPAAEKSGEVIEREWKKQLKDADAVATGDTSNSLTHRVVKRGSLNFIARVSSATKTGQTALTAIEYGRKRGPIVATYSV